ncbi:hypothetical protein [Gorillibacterium timonense]|uniref:hypothetical protein n=1 Tax=Gorillibacterium timonense TaxID=1689269 RepID=UPI00071E23C8|nr:hypothetical protein [Gorillibacterium timonense]
MKDEHLQDDLNIKQSSWHLEDVERALQSEQNDSATLEIHDGRAEDIVKNEATLDEDDREAEVRAAAADARALSGEDVHD